MKLENDLGNDPILRLVFRIAIPSMLGQFNTRSSVGPHVHRQFLKSAIWHWRASGVCGPILTMIVTVAFGSE